MKKNLLFLWLMVQTFAGWSLPVQNGVYTAKKEAFAYPVNLDGEWDFYWQTTFADYRILKDSLVAEKLVVPGNWDSYGHPKLGYGLFVIKVTGYNPDNQMALKMPTISNAFRLYINGKQVAKGGVFGTSKELSIPDYTPQMVTFTPNSDTLEIAFEVSNFYYREGGLDYSIQLGEVDSIALEFRRDIIVEAFITGALLLMFFYFMGYYFIRMIDKTALYFSLLCLSAAMRMVSTQEILLRQFEIPVSWDWLFKMELISIAMIPAFGALYLFSLLNQTRYLNILKAFNFVTFLICLYLLFNNVYWGSHIVPPFRYYALTEMVLLLIVVARSVILRQHPLAALASVGYFFVFVFGINDILYSVGVINTFYAMPIAIFIYVFIQAIVLAKKYNNAFIDVENLSGELQRVNKNQETVIQHRTAELEGYNKIKDKIFSIISHDLRAPIATLSSVLSMAEDADDKTVVELRSYFKGIKRNVDNLNLTIDNMLVWSQGQINGIEIKPEVINLSEEVELCISLYSLVALQKEITLMHSITESFKVKVDPAHLSLILRNTISNSLKFTNLGGSIILSASRATPDKVKICITDNGIGIHADRIDELFNPQLHYSTYGTQNEKGTGLGLMLCKEYAEQNGGSITIESEEGKGAKVCVFLPAAFD
ncbi:MAG: sensor histidine kinase [Bacteroidota bacterium]